jgi:ABC-type glycerol-3-phosphate transport system permease component
MLALPFCMWILQSFLNDIPRELEEAAMVEGASQLGAFARVTVPQAMPGIIAAGTFAYIMSWGEYMFAYVLMSDEASHTVPVALQQLLGSYAIDWGLLAATCVVATLPVLALFWLMAKYLGEGIAKGAGAV